MMLFDVFMYSFNLFIVALLLLTLAAESRPGLNKVARALNINCSAAIVAWDFHSGFNHPM
jgi:Rad4 beta-hairpin domain 3